jgi:hypothetical protein
MWRTYSNPDPRSDVYLCESSMVKHWKIFFIAMIDGVEDPQRMNNKLTTLDLPSIPINIFILALSYNL